MDTLINAAASFGEITIETVWFPLAVWTVITAIVLYTMKAFDRIHSQYHYHIRLALITALPVGVLASYLIQVISASSETSYFIISVMSPIEVGVSGVGDESTYSFSELLYTTLSLLLISGMLYFSTRYLIQWTQLCFFKNRSSFHPIGSVPEVDQNILRLSKSIGKEIMIGFSESEVIPVTFGSRKPLILLPASLRKSPQKLNLAIRHELTHVRQNDFATHLFVTAIKSLFWFHPFVHVLSQQITDYREMRCDSLVLSDQSVSKKEYATLLLELLPMPNLDQDISVNMAQESSNIKKRIQMMTQTQTNHIIPRRSSFALLGVLLAGLVLAMACTDMQTQNVFDEEELNLMTDMDTSGERGYHQVIIYMGDDQQDERHSETLTKLDQLQPEHIKEVEVLKGDKAIEAYGDRASEGVILIKTQLNQESYNTVLSALGMQDAPPSPPEPGDVLQDSMQDMPPPPPEDYFVVVEEMPELVGGLDEVQKNIRYPETAREAGIEGRVYVQFIVDENGDVQDPKVIRGIGGGADQEAVRAVKQAKFRPGMQRGQAVRVQYSLPIFFRLNTTEPSEEEENSENGTSVVGYN